jgi:hypothetical protein
VNKLFAVRRCGCNYDAAGIDDRGAATKPDEERAERRAIDARLDAIARSLTESCEPKP